MRKFSIVTVDHADVREVLTFVVDAEYLDNPDNQVLYAPEDYVADYINPELYKSVKFIGTWW